MEYICPRCSSEVSKNAKHCKKCNLCLDGDCPMDLINKYRKGRTCKWEHEEEYN